MLHTMPEAELITPFPFGPAGIRSWHWVELTLQRPYFLLTLENIGVDWRQSRHILVAELRKVIEIVDTQTDDLKVSAVCLVSPNYLNGTDNYQMGELAQAWVGKKKPQEQLFLLRDGSRYQMPPSRRKLQEKNMKLVLNFSQGQNTANKPAETKAP